mgnify:CR=1 FL=1
MLIPPYIIEKYLISRFQNYRISGREFLIDSVFMEDTKKHMSINLDTGLWQDFKASETGNFTQLVSYVDCVSISTAIKFVRAQMFSDPETLFASSCIEKNESLTKNTVSELFKDFSKFDIKNVNPSDLTERLAYKFITERKLQAWDFYICKTGKFSNRVIIPYMYEGDSFFFQGRNLSRYGMKYLNPSRENGGVKSSDVLFPFDNNADYVFITEGPLDAITLRIHGYNATCTQGSFLSYEQAKQLKGKRIIFAYDSDEAGKSGVQKGIKVLLNRNINSCYVSVLPKGYKDWNEVHVAKNRKEFDALLDDSITKTGLDFTVRGLLE